MKFIKIFFFIISMTTFFTSFDKKKEKFYLLNFSISELEELSFEKAQIHFLENYMDFKFYFKDLDTAYEDMRNLNFEEKNEDFFKIKEKHYSESDFINKITAKLSYDEGSIVKKYLSFNTLQVPLGEKILYKIETVYYRDGAAKKYEDNAPSPYLKSMYNYEIVDSVQVKINYRYFQSCIPMKLSESKRFVKIDDSKIKVISFDHNMITFLMDNKIYDRYITSQAVSASGNLVNYTYSNGFIYRPDKLKKMLSKLLKSMDLIAENIETKKYKTKEEFLSDVKKVTLAANGPKSDKMYIRQGYRTKEPQEIIIYLGDKLVEKEFSLTIPVDFKEKIWDGIRR